jgi:secreted trypsin-like serine protease
LEKRCIERLSESVIANSPHDLKAFFEAGRNYPGGCLMETSKRKLVGGRLVRFAFRCVFGVATTCTVLGTVACSKPSASNNQLLPSGIIGGTDATGSEDFSKSIVSVYNTVETSLCTASLISDSIAVTAAHCVAGAKASDLNVLFGTDLTNGTAAAQEVVAFEANALYATNSEQEFNTGDIALVHFSGGLPAGYQVAQVLGDLSALQNGTSVLLAGYGINDGVKSTGAGILRFVQTAIENAAYSTSEVLIDQTQGRGACHGDSGGPAYVQVNGQWLLWGVTNRGVNDPSNNCSVASAYTSIPYYQDWIQTTAAKLLKSRRTPSRRQPAPALAAN